MADIYTVYTAEQLYDMYRLYLLGKSVGITDFNTGSKIRAIIESNSEIISSIIMDFKNALMKAIPIALYEGFGFTQLAATSATGYLRPYREPALYIRYTGAGSSALITSSSTQIAAVVTGAGDAFTLLYVTYPTLNDLITAINLLPNWSATLVKSGTLASSSLFQYTSEEVINSLNYLNADGLDLTLDTAVEIPILTGFSVSINNLQILTLADATLLAGHSGVQITAQVSQTGILGNISANAIDTKNGKGSINSNIPGIENVINDSSFSGGLEQETDAARQTRFSETVNALNAGTKNGIIAALKSISGVRSVGMRTAYPFKGTNTILVDDGSGIISPALLAEVNLVLYGDPNNLSVYPGKDAAGITYNIEAPTIIPINISITVYRLSTVNVDLTAIQTDVQSAIEQYINTLQLNQSVLLSAVTTVARNSNAAIYDVTITYPATNVTIGTNEFAKTGAGTGGAVTVTMALI